MKMSVYVYSAYRTAYRWGGGLVISCDWPVRRLAGQDAGMSAHNESLLTAEKFGWQIVSCKLYAMKTTFV
jgi:hypothetical protein